MSKIFDDHNFDNGCCINCGFFYQNCIFSCKEFLKNCNSHIWVPVNISYNYICKVCDIRGLTLRSIIGGLAVKDCVILYGSNSGYSCNEYIMIKANE